MEMSSEPLTMMNMPDKDYYVEDDPVLLTNGSFDLQNVHLDTLPDLSFDVLNHFQDFPKMPERGPPERTQFSGQYDFGIEINSSHTNKKKYVFSHKLRRIYVDIDMDFSVQFTWHGPSAMNVRATCVFADEAQAEKRVERCVQHFHQSSHTDPTISRNVLHSSRDVTGGGVHYRGDPNIPDSWLSVVVELTKPNDGSTQHAYRFTCKNSCTSGINRRAILIVFTLEDQSGTIYGRDIVGARVCACPRRDMIKDEESEGVPRGAKRRAPMATPPPDKVKRENCTGDFIVDLATLRPRSAILGLEAMINMEEEANESRRDPRAQDVIARLKQIQDDLKAKHPAQ